MWNTIRKSMFTICAVIFAPSGVMMQTWAALVLLLFYVAVFVLAKPYDKPYLNHLERNALSINVVTLLLGVGLFTNDRSGVDSKSEVLAVAISGVIICSNLCFVLNVVLTLMKHSQYCSCCKSRQVKRQGRTATVVPKETDKNRRTIVALQLRHGLHLALNKKRKENEGSLQFERSRSRIKQQKSIRTKKVEQIQKVHAIHRNSKILSVQHQQLQGNVRLQARLAARKNNRKVQAVTTTVRPMQKIRAGADAPPIVRGKKKHQKKLRQVMQLQQLPTIPLLHDM